MSTEHHVAAIKKCRHCCCDMPAAAKICLQCKLHQSNFRNHLTLLAGLGGLIALLTYITSSLGEIRKNLFWVDDINIISVDHRSFVIRNVGDGDVFIVGARYEFDLEGHRFTEGVAFGESISPGKFAKIQPKKVALEGGVLEVGSISKLSDVASALRMTRSRPDCIEDILVSTNSSAYNTFSNHLGKKLMEHRVNPRIIYYSRGTIPLEKKFDGAILFIIQGHKKDCWE